MVMLKDELYRKVVKTWGLPAQIGMMMEEAAELIVSCNHYLRDGKTESMIKMAYEIADVEIVIEQLKESLNIVHHVEDEKERKLLRLESRLKSFLEKPIV